MPTPPNPKRFADPKAPSPKDGGPTLPCSRRSTPSSRQAPRNSLFENIFLKTHPNSPSALRPAIGTFVKTRYWQAGSAPKQCPESSTRTSRISGRKIRGDQHDTHMTPAVEGVHRSPSPPPCSRMGTPPPPGLTAPPTARCSSWTSKIPNKRILNTSGRTVRRQPAPQSVPAPLKPVAYLGI